MSSWIDVFLIGMIQDVEPIDRCLSIAIDFNLEQMKGSYDDLLDRYPSIKHLQNIILGVTTAIRLVSF
jgi:hypothetical protein